MPAVAMRRPPDAAMLSQQPEARKAPTGIYRAAPCAAEEEVLRGKNLAAGYGTLGAGRLATRRLCAPLQSELAVPATCGTHQRRRSHRFGLFAMRQPR